MKVIFNRFRPNRFNGTMERLWQILKFPVSRVKICVLKNISIEKSELLQGENNEKKYHLTGFNINFIGRGF